MQSIIELLHRAEQASKAIFACIPLPAGAEGVTPRQYAVLAAVGAASGASQTELVKATSIDRSTLAVLVRRLEVRGLIRRVRTKEDARAYSVSLTAKGETMVDAMRPVSDGANSRMLDALGDGEREAFVAALEKLAAMPLSAYTV